MEYLSFFREDGKLDFLTELLKLARMMSANISTFPLIILEEISVFWHVLGVSNFKLSPRISFLFIFEKKNGCLGCLLHTFSIASILGWFLYVTTYFKTGTLTLSARHSHLNFL